LLEQVIITVHKNESRTDLTLRLRGGSLTDLDLDTPRRRATIVRTDEETIALEPRLAAHYPGSDIAGILNRQGRKSPYGHCFTANLVSGLHRNGTSPVSNVRPTRKEGELLTVKQTAAALGVASSTIHRWLSDGVITEEQFTLLPRSEAARLAGRLASHIGQCHGPRTSW
jgi:hypothetical protein